MIISITVILLFSIVGTGYAAETSIWDGQTYDTSWFKDQGHGEEYTLTTAAQLAGLIDLVGGKYDKDKGGNGTDKKLFKDTVIKLGANIDLAGHEWIPIGTLTLDHTSCSSSSGFQGTFDGCGYTISNMKITNDNAALNLASRTTARVGFFAILGNNAVVKNVIFENPTVTVSKSGGNIKKLEIGIVVGSGTQATSKIDSVTVTDASWDVKAATGGGIVGTGYNINNCQVSGSFNVNGGGNDFGGIAGTSRQIAHTIQPFENNKFSGTISGSTYYAGYLIGLAAYSAEDATAALSVKNCSYAGASGLSDDKVYGTKEYDVEIVRSNENIIGYYSLVFTDNQVQDNDLVNVNVVSGAFPTLTAKNIILTSVYTGSGWWSTPTRTKVTGSGSIADGTKIVYFDYQSDIDYAAADVTFEDCKFSSKNGFSGCSATGLWTIKDCTFATTTTSMNFGGSDSWVEIYNPTYTGTDGNIFATIGVTHNGLIAVDPTKDSEGKYVRGPENLIGRFSKQLPDEKVSPLFVKTIIDEGYGDIYILKRSYTISATANPTAGGSVTGAKIYREGDSVTLTATANPDYKFLNWTESGIEISSNEILTFTATADRNLIANFARTPSTIDPGNTVAYLVEHYKAGTSGYVLKETEYLTGTIGETVTATQKQYTGYTFNSTASTVSGTLKSIQSNDDIVVLKLYYDITASTILPGDTVAYLVEHYKAGTSGYVLEETEYLTGTVEETVTATPKEYTDYTFNAAASTVSGTLKPIQSDADIVILKLYYEENIAPFIPDETDPPRGSSIWLTETPTPTPPTETPTPGDDDPVTPPADETGKRDLLWHIISMILLKLLIFWFIILLFIRRVIYRILKRYAKDYDYEVDRKQFKEISKNIIRLIRDKETYPKWRKDPEIAAMLKHDIIRILNEMRYPPLPRDEIVTDILKAGKGKTTRWRL